MTDKEQIMIDDVDVSGCDNHGSQGNCIIYGNIPCDCFPNCSFKQLSRKEQKYNLLVKTNEKHVNLLDQLNNKYINLEQECEQKEKELNRYRKAFEDIEKAIAIYSSRHQFSIANDLYNQIFDIINEAKRE